MRSPARSRARNALAPPPGCRQVRPVVIKYHVPEVPDRKVQFADGLLDFPGRTVIADQPRHGFQRQSRREQPATVSCMLLATWSRSWAGRKVIPAEPAARPSGGPRVGRTPASSPGITPSQGTLEEVRIAEAPGFPSGRDWPCRQGPGRRGACTLAVARCRLLRTLPAASLRLLPLPGVMCSSSRDNPADAERLREVLRRYVEGPWGSMGAAGTDGT